MVTVGVGDAGAACEAGIIASTPTVTAVTAPIRFMADGFAAQALKSCLSEGDGDL
jgi:hypothetical protein